MFETFEVVFPEDERNDHKIFYADYEIRRKVVTYTVLLAGITYEEINRNISFTHEEIEGGIHFRSSVALHSFRLSILVIHDPRMIKFQKKF